VHAAAMQNEPGGSDIDNILDFGRIKCRLSSSLQNARQDNLQAGIEQYVERFAKINILALLTKYPFHT